VGSNKVSPFNWSVWIQIRLFGYEFDSLNWKLALLPLRLQKIQKNPKKLNFTPYKYPHDLSLTHSHINSFLLSWYMHTQCLHLTQAKWMIKSPWHFWTSWMKRIVHAEEAATTSTSSSTRRSKLRWCYVNRDREATHFRLRHDYFNDDCIYPLSYFLRMYHMRMTFFLSIMHKLSEISPYFSERYDATDRGGLTALQKCTAALL
jgi:hypothetical protein